MASKNAAFHEQGIAGVLLTPLKWFCISLMLLFGLILAAWIIDWVFVFRVWPDGITRLQSILEQDIARTYLIECWYSDLPKRATGTANLLYSLIFRVTGIHDMGASFADGAGLSIPDTIVRNGYLANFEAIQVAMLGTQLIGVRMATLVVALPLIALAYGVGMADGLVQRAVRRASGGRESASLYHRAKHFQLVILVTTAAACLLWPESINSRIIWLQGLAGSAILVRIQWIYYKKHL